MKRQLTLLLMIALLAVPAVFADHHLNGVQNVKFDVLLSPSHQSPPLEGIDVSGQATVEFSIVREGGVITSAMVDFHVNWRAGQVEELRAMHIHQGAAGTNGSVVINANLGAQAASTGGVIFRQVKVEDAELIEKIMANPAGYYVNVHSVSSPSGLVRGQLRMDAASQLNKVQAELEKRLGDINAKIREGFGFPPDGQ